LLLALLLNMKTANPFKHLDDAGCGYDAQVWYKYFDVQTTQDGQRARFKKHRITGATYVWQANCCKSGNCWNEPGYGWGVWRKV
jgi:hypothetical protein